MHYTQKAGPRGSGYADQQLLAAATQRAVPVAAAAAAGEGAPKTQKRKNPKNAAPPRLIEWGRRLCSHGRPEQRHWFAATDATAESVVWHAPPCIYTECAGSRLSSGRGISMDAAQLGCVSGLGISTSPGSNPGLCSRFFVAPPFFLHACPHGCHCRPQPHGHRRACDASHTRAPARL